MKQDLLKAQYKRFIEFANETFGEEFALELIEWIPTYKDFAAIVYAHFNGDIEENTKGWLSWLNVKVDELELAHFTNIIRDTQNILACNQETKDGASERRSAKL